jgi:hypothetical protein
MVDFWTPSPYRLFDLSGEVAVVTGATGVLGGVMARSYGPNARDRRKPPLGRRASSTVVAPFWDQALQFSSPSPQAR